MVPYETCDVEAWSVVQVIVAKLAVKPDAVTSVMTGEGFGAVPVVVKLESGDVEETPEEFVETTE